MLGNYQEETKAGANLKTKRASTLILANSNGKLQTDQNNKALEDKRGIPIRNK